jgi:hypothetical protein
LNGIVARTARGGAKKFPDENKKTLQRKTVLQTKLQETHFPGSAKDDFCMMRAGITFGADTARG